MAVNETKPNEFATGLLINPISPLYPNPNIA